MASGPLVVVIHVYLFSNIYLRHYTIMYITVARTRIIRFVDKHANLYYVLHMCRYRRRNNEILRLDDICLRDTQNLREKSDARFFFFDVAVNLA